MDCCSLAFLYNQIGRKSISFGRRLFGNHVATQITLTMKYMKDDSS